MDYLHGSATLEQVCRRLPSGVTVIPGQIARGDTASLLASVQFKELLRVAGTSFDLVLVDSAPILAVPDNLLLVGFIDQVILVAKATHTSTRDLRKAQAAIERAGGRLLGVILNGAHANDVPYYHPRYRKYYTPSTTKDAQVTPRRVSPASPVEAKKGSGETGVRDGQRKKEV
jgi:Mrp family chromosome partitioning ATPase